MPRFPLMHWILCCLVVAALAVTGCSTDTTTSGESTGSLGLSLELAPGVEINEVAWVISRPGMADMEGTIDTSAPGTTASVEVFGLPPGDGYTVTLTAMVEGEDTPCIGSADFSVEIGISTPVMVMLNCKRPERLGGVRVNGKFNVCADLAKVIVSPLQTSVGNDIDLSALAQDVDDDQEAIRYRWMATGGSIADPNARITTYTCEEVGESHTIIIRVSDDPDEFGEFCMDQWDVQVACVEGEGGLCDGNTCDDDDTECSHGACNPLNGECFDTPINEGGDCMGGEGTCMSGDCIISDLCEVHTCDDTNTDCNEGACNPLNGECFDTPINEGQLCDGGVCMSGDCVDLCEAHTCDDTNTECNEGACNPLNGECFDTPINEDGDCMGGEGTCMDGDCIIGDLCEVHTCDDTNTDCNEGACNPVNGECFDTPINEGQLCDGGVCMSGDCVDLCEVHTCDDTNTECNEGACNPLNGECFDTPINEDGDCMGGEGTCMSGSCIVVDLCAGNMCDDDDTECNDSSCDQGTGGCVDAPINEGGTCEDVNVCMEGVCVDLCAGNMCDDNDTECNDSSCNSLTGQCEDSAINEGGSCDSGSGTCMSGDCVPSAVDPCQDTNPLECTKPVTLGCTNNITGDISILPWILTTDPTPIVASSPVTVDFTGDAVFSESFLDAGLAAVPGLKFAELISGVATALVRTGLTGPPVPIPAAPIPSTCSPISFNAGEPCVTAADCPPGAPFTTCGQFVEIATVDGIPNSAGGCTPVLGAVPDCDCTPCDDLNPCTDGSDCKSTQCQANGYCIDSGGLSIPLDEVSGNFVADAVGVVRIGWDDVNTGATINTDGTYTLPAASFPAAVEPNGLRVIAAVLQVALQCTMAVDSAGPAGVAVCSGGPNDGQACEAPASDGNDICFNGTNDGDPCQAAEDCPGGECANADCGIDGSCGPADEASPTPNSALISFPIQ